MADSTDVPAARGQYTEIHQLQAKHQVEEAMYRMGYREK